MTACFWLTVRDFHVTGIGKKLVAYLVLKSCHMNDSQVPCIFTTPFPTTPSLPFLQRLLKKATKKFRNISLQRWSQHFTVCLRCCYSKQRTVLLLLFKPGTATERYQWKKPFYNLDNFELSLFG
jgi:hypothetical protein